MMKASTWTIAALALALAACGGDAPQASANAEADDQVVEDAITRRVPQFENEHVEVWKSIILPNQPLSMHRHDNPRAIIALKGGTLTVINEAGDSKAMTWETGRAYWLEADIPGELHGDVNEGTEPVEVIVVQMKNPAGG
jgi:quercetin dioxygenase-like cupin family protein